MRSVPKVDSAALEDTAKSALRRRSAKRSDISFVQYGGHHGDSNAYADTRYFVTFQTENGERTELAVEGREYGMLAEGDSGQLTFQGTRYMGFERNVPSSEL